MGAEAPNHGIDLDIEADEERTRFRAYGTQLIATHMRLREMLEDLHEIDTRELQSHCLAFCEAVTRHHTAEDRTVFPLLSARHPELRAFLSRLRQDHSMISWMLRSLSTREDLDAIGAVLETHFRGEEKRLVDVLNAIDPDEHGDIGLLA